MCNLFSHPSKKQCFTLIKTTCKICPVVQQGDNGFQTEYQVELAEFIFLKI